ncbi:MAG: DUF6887 family protein [Spirulinaceae cyanobacterium]
MSQVDYAVMSIQELRQYFLRHREDKAALRAYLERLNSQSKAVITTVDDPDFEVKIQAEIERQMKSISP